MVKRPALLKPRLAIGSFRRQLTLVSSVGLLGLALAISLVSSEWLNDRLEKLALTLLGELTGQLAKASRVIFLGSPDVAIARLTELATFPGIQQAALLKSTSETWVVSDRAAHRWPTLSGSEWQVGSTLTQENQHTWYFAAPVRLEADVTPLATSNESLLLGYIRVAWRKEPLIALQRGFFILNGSIALSLAIVISMVLLFFLRRLTGPLDQLVSVMRRLRHGEVGARATLVGPTETREIGQMFNALLDELERHQKELESIVTLRTQDLRAARDAALTATRYKSEFMAAMTHEMRMPLQSIIGYTQAGQKELFFLEDEADPIILGNAAKYLRIVLSASDELLSRINQVLELAALEAGKQEIKLKVVDLPLVLDQMVSIIKPLAKGHHNHLDVIYQGPVHVEIDEDKLQQIVRNLLDNACKFTENGAISLEVCHATDGLVIVVTDSGIGIPANQIDLIFEPFRQADMSDTRRYGGIGLGLAITQNICQLLGGTITVDSTPGVGSRFRVEIPLPIR